MPLRHLPARYLEIPGGGMSGISIHEDTVRLLLCHQEISDHVEDIGVVLSVSSKRGASMTVTR
jgi:hypothetical protein